MKTKSSVLVLTLQCGLETVAVSTVDQSVVDFESDDTRHMEAILEAPTNPIFVSATLID